MACYFSSAAFGGMEPAEMLAELSSFDSLGLEFTAGLAHDSNWPDRLGEWHEQGHRLLIHNYFPPPASPFVLNLAARDELTNSASQALVERALELTARLGAPFYSVHAGFALELRPEHLGDHSAQSRRELDAFPPEAAIERFVQNVRRLGAIAQRLGIRLLLENNVVSNAHVAAERQSHLLMATPAEIIRLSKQWADLPVGLLLDVGHAKVTAQSLGFSPETFFETLGPQIEALHLSDNDAVTDSNGEFGEAAWFAPFLPAFSHLPMVMEVYRGDKLARARQWQTLSRLLNS